MDRVWQSIVFTVKVVVRLSVRVWIRWGLVMVGGRVGLRSR